MRINGIQKLTLLDFPGRVACTVFSAGCNLRCPFCHNAGLVVGRAEEVMTVEEFFTFLGKRKGVLEGVAMTGGEPLLQNDLYDFAARIKEMGFAVKLDTNGTLPDKLERVISGGVVDYIAMDIKNSPKKYSVTVGVDVGDELMDRIRTSVSMLLSGRTEYEFRTTVTAELHERSDFEEIGGWIAGAEKYFLQQFRDSGELLSGGLTAPTAEAMADFADAARPYVKSVALRGV